MKKTLFLVLIALFCGQVFASAQLTSGNPTAAVYKTGNRPEAGNWGVYFGATTQIFNFNLAPNELVQAAGIKVLPLVNVKYFISDQMEGRLGINVWHHRTSGQQMPDVDNAAMQKQSNVEGEFNLYPGIAYHFSKNNLLDVYMGAELPLGFLSNSNQQSGQDYSSRSSVFNPYIGVGAFIGLQGFIGNLPLGIALEYGISAKVAANNLPKVVETNGTITQSYYGDEGGQRYRAYSRGQGWIGQEIRLTLSYYFK